MPPNDDSLFQEVLRTLADVSERLVKSQVETKEYVIELLKNHREDAHRVSMGIHLRLLSYEDDLNRDRTARKERQVELDKQLHAIRRNQQIWIRTVLALALLAIGAGVAVAIVWWL